jgi:hypothetical protein
MIKLHHLLSSLFFTLLIFALAEIGMRIFWTPQFIGELACIYYPSFSFGYDIQDPLCYKDGDFYKCPPTQYRKINKQTFPIVKTKEQIRIFTLGGSMSWGNRSYTKRLVEKLNIQHPNRTWYGINLSALGFGTARMVEIAKKIERYSPDLIIIDPTGTNEYEDEQHYALASQINSGLRGLLYESHLLVVIRKYLGKSFGQFMKGKKVFQTLGFLSETEAGENTENLKRWNSSLDNNLQKMIELLSQENRHIILMARPKPYQLGEPDRDRYALINYTIKSKVSKDVSFFDSHSFMHEYAAKHNLDILEFFTRDKNHLSSKGFEVLAEGLSDVLKLRHSSANQLELIPQPYHIVSTS